MLKKMKLLLGISTDNDERDELLNLLIESAQARLKVLLGGLNIPEELEYVIVEAAVSRFNRIGSEGTKSHSVVGESLSFEADDFAGYTDVIQAYLDKVNSPPGKGGIRWI